MTNDEAERKARADSLRKRIARLTNPDDDETAPNLANEQDTSAAESPREFVERRMREVEKERELNQGE